MVAALDVDADRGSGDPAGVQLAAVAEVAGWRHLDRGSGAVLIYDARSDTVSYGA